MLKKIKVECYAGSRADERPRRVIIEDRTHVVARLLYHSIEESLNNRAQAHRYKVLTDEGLTLEIIRTNDGEWFLQSKKHADY
jgi:hypothetical protein